MSDPVQDGIGRARAEGWLHRVVVALDMTANVLIGGRPDQTLSSRCAIAAAAGNRAAKVGLWILDHTLGRQHGRGAELADLGRAEIVETIEQDATEVRNGRDAAVQKPNLSGR